MLDLRKLLPILYTLVAVAGWATIPASILIFIDIKRRGVRFRLSRIREYTSDRVYKEWIWAFVFLAVDFAWATVFLLYPILSTVGYSLTNFSLVADLKWQGLENYIRIVTDPIWWHSCWVTLQYTIGAVPISITISLVIALLIIRLPEFGQTFFKAAYYLPGVTSTVVMAVILRWIFNPMYGFANLFLGSLGVAPQMWFGSSDQALFTVILTTWLGSHGVGILIYCAALGGIPKSYYEAADLDAASAFTKFRRITLPLLKPASLYVLITNLIGSLQVFGPALLITNGGPSGATQFVNYYIYETFYRFRKMGMAAAMSVVLMILIVGISIVNYRAFSSDVEY
jgi:multiple sugar transport system permease protein